MNKMPFLFSIFLLFFFVARADAATGLLSLDDDKHNGNLHAHPDWWAWDASGGAFVYDVEGSRLTWAGRDQIAVYQRPFPAGLWDRQVAVDFRMGGLGDAAGPIWLPGLTMGIKANAPGAVGIQLWRPRGEGGRNHYQLYAVIGAAAEGETGDHRTWGKPFDRNLIGDDGSLGTVSDRLRMELFLSKSGANSWLLRGRLFNRDRGEVISEVEFSGASLSADYNQKDHFAVFRSGRPTSLELLNAETQPDLPELSMIDRDATALGGALLWAGAPIPNHDEIPVLDEVSFHVIKPFQPEVDNLRWQHESSLAWHKGSLFAAYGAHPWAENVPGSSVFYQVSPSFAVRGLNRLFYSISPQRSSLHFFFSSSSRGGG